MNYLRRRLAKATHYTLTPRGISLEVIRAALRANHAKVYHVSSPSRREGRWERSPFIIPLRCGGERGGGLSKNLQ